MPPPGMEDPPVFGGEVSAMSGSTPEMFHAAFLLAGLASDTDLALPWTDLLDQTDGFLTSTERHSLPWYCVSESWNEHLMPLIMNKSSFEMEDGKTKGIFSTIPPLLSNAKEGSPLDLARKAVSCAYLANTTRSSNAISNRSQAYGIALTAINQALQDPQQYRSDSTLLGVWLLSLYEVR